MTLRLAALLILAAMISLNKPALAGKQDNSIRFGNQEVLENVDPYFNNTRLGVIVGQHVWDTLVYRDPENNQYKGQLATGWKWVDDRTLDFELRRGVKFHDGTPFDADDVVYTLNFISKQENKVVNQQYVSWIDRGEKIDTYKVRLISKRPFPAALDYLSQYIPIHPHAYYAAVGPKGMNEKPVGTGPFRVVEHAIGKFVRLERNRDYFAESPKLQPRVDKVEIRFIPDQQTRTAEMLSGGLDFMMAVPVDIADQMTAVPFLNVQPGETQRVAFLHLNTTERTHAPVLRDARVRQAIFHAIDRDKMVSSIVGKGARVLHTLCSAAQFGCTDEDVVRYEYDPQKSKQLLAEAGHPDGFEIDLYAYRDRQQTEALINYLRAVGIKANMQFMQFAAMREQVRSGKASFAHETWGTLVNDVSAMTSIFFKFTPDDTNRDEAVRELLERGDSSIDPSVRRVSYARALALIAERAYALPLYTLPTYYVSAKELSFAPPKDELPKFWAMGWK
jgi:peptide/nickel transport system substrate-binding protein